MNRRRSRKLSVVATHVVVWLLVFLLPYSVMLGAEDSVPSYWLLRLVFLNLLLIIVFYFNTEWLIPKTIFKNRSRLFFLGASLILLLFAFTTEALRYVLDELLFPDFMDDGVKTLIPLLRDDGRMIVFRFFPPLLVIAVGTSIKITARWRSNEMRQQDQQREQLKTELALLKAQINPHFFFNTLNNIYSLIELDVEKAQSSVLKLSKLMRYHLYKTNKDFVAIESEIEFVADYLDLMKLRLHNFVQIDFSQNIKNSHDEIPPLLLEPFIENAFKHGVSYSQPSRVSLTLSSNTDYLHFHIENTVHQKTVTKPQEGGLGIQNVERRLKLLFKPEQYHLKHSNDGAHFSVTLQIPVRRD